MWDCQKNTTLDKKERNQRNGKMEEQKYRKDIGFNSANHIINMILRFGDNTGMSRQIRSKPKYDQSALDLAVTAVQSKTMSLRTASRSYAIPISLAPDQKENATI
ncbi:uncharacterized protein LOC128558703 [Mercenaria mercenaria]|uniref:uncharacterized protein LOC128558703 n=1 Tax=Mercenaria mercenaria TaxID=6596 RepID=UPI00234FAF42|nr:uncharacterized protein LOC128558703 [Mercenaria mercenaria]